MFLTRFLLILCILNLSSVYAEVYKWTDKNGNVHYSDQKNENADEIDLTLEEVDKKKSSSNREQQRKKLLEAMKEDREQKEKIKQEEMARKNKLKRKCQWAKDELKNIESAAGVYDLDKNGKRVLLADDERRKMVKNMKQKIKKHCS